MEKIQEKIYQEIQDVYSTPTEKRKILKLVKSEIQKQRFKEVPDNIVLKIIKNFISGAEEMITLLDETNDHKDYIFNRRIIEVLSPYLPEMVGYDEIKTYIDSMDISKYKNIMQAMKPIMEHFGSTVDGNKVKSILLTMNKG